MYIEAVPNRNPRPANLLRESYREDGKVRKRTLCNLSDWPTAHIEGLRGVFKGGIVIPTERDAFTVIRCLPHGHVVATLGTARNLGLNHRGHQVGRSGLDLLASRAGDQVAGHPTSPASAWWSAAILISPPSAPASAKNSLPPQSEICPHPDRRGAQA